MRDGAILGPRHRATVEDQVEDSELHPLSIFVGKGNDGHLRFAHTEGTAETAETVETSSRYPKRGFPQLAQLAQWGP
jgi:hypothetical protein